MSLQKMANSRYHLLRYLRQHADPQLEMSYPELAIHCGLSERTIQYAVQDLEERGLITIQRRDGEQGYKLPNIYQLTGQGVTCHIPEWVVQKTQGGAKGANPDAIESVPHKGGARGGANAGEFGIDSVTESTLLEKVEFRLLELGVDQDVVLWVMAHATLQHITDLILRFKQAVNVRNISGFFIDAIKRGWGAIIEQTSPEPLKPDPPKYTKKIPKSQPVQYQPQAFDDDFSSEPVFKSSHQEDSPPQPRAFLTFKEAFQNTMGRAVYKEYIEHAQLLEYTEDEHGNCTTATIQLSGETASDYIRVALKTLNRTFFSAIGPSSAGAQVTFVGMA